MKVRPIFTMPGVRAPLAFGKTFLQRGLTMIELMIVIAIAAILALLAIPSMVSTLHGIRQNSALSLLVSDLNLARGEAIKRNARVLVCVRNTAGTDCGNGTNWQVGWIVCVDANSDGECDSSSSASPNPILVRPALDATLTLTTSAEVIRFNANSSQGSNSATATLTLGGTWSDATARTIAVAGTGHISK